MIVYGQLVAADGFVRRSEIVQDTRAPGWRVRSRYTYEPLELHAIATPCPLTHGHAGARLGTVRYVELGKGGDVWAVADVDQPIPDPGDEHGSLYFSVEAVGPEDGAKVTAIAITATPAMTLRPLAIIPERTLDQLVETTTLRMRRDQGHAAGLLERARDARRKPPTAVVDLRSATRAADSPMGGWLDRDDQRPAGELWHRPCGAILSVH